MFFTWEKKHQVIWKLKLQNFRKHEEFATYYIHIDSELFKPRDFIFVFEHSGDVYTGQGNHVWRMYENEVHFVGVINNAPV